MKPKLIKHGAEAKLFLIEHLGQKAVLKVREKKGYREKSLDKKIISERLRTECTLLSRAKKTGVRTPLIYKIEPEKFSIITEFVEGETMNEWLGKKPMDAKTLCAMAGADIAKLHSHGIIHGDLTTSNIIVQQSNCKNKTALPWRKGKDWQGQDCRYSTGQRQNFWHDGGKTQDAAHSNLVFLDFGIGFFSDKAEDKAVDLLAFKKMFLSTHFKCMKAWKALEEAYSGAYEGTAVPKARPTEPQRGRAPLTADASAVLKQIPKIEARARYY